MYIAWTIITLPVSWLCIEWGHSDYSLPLKIVYLFRMTLFSGSCGIYWYLLALMECSLILFICVKKNVETSMYIFAVILFIIGIAYNSPLNKDNYLFQFIHIVFGSERNFLNTGLLYICAGFYIANHSIQPNKITLIIALATSILLRTIEIQYLHTNFFQSLIAIFLFLFAQQTNIRINDSVSLQIRKMSVALYLLHFPFLLVYDYHFSRNTISGFISATAFSLVTFHLLKHFTSEKTMKLLFG
jgi:hypothetical protein